MKLKAILALLPLATVACEARQGRTLLLRTEIRDSADVRIVENTEPLSDSRLSWRIGPQPSVSIGTLEGDEPYMLHYTFDATRLHDGRIVVANGGTNELRVFDPSGVHVETWGGEGGGPGEFTDLSQVDPWPGDSIIAWHAPRFGIAVFDAQGNHGRTFALVHDEATSPMLRFWPEHATRDGLILATHRPHGSGADTIVVQLRDGEGRVRSSFGTHPGNEPYIHAEGTDRAMLFMKTFGREPVWASCGDQVVIGDTRSYQFRVFRADGSLARILRRDHIPRPPRPDEVEAYIEGQLAVNMPASEADSQRLRRQFQSVPVAEHFPAFASVMCDAAGHLWVEEYESLREERRAPLWTVFDPEGRALGFVETPKDLSIYEIGQDYILGQVHDELDVERVQVWPLDRSGI